MSIIKISSLTLTTLGFVMCSILLGYVPSHPTMVAVREFLASVALKAVCSKLVNATMKEIALQLNFNEDLGSIEDKLSLIQSYLNDTERRSSKQGECFSLAEEAQGYRFVVFRASDLPLLLLFDLIILLCINCSVDSAIDKLLC